MLKEKATIERKDARSKCMANRLRLGQFITQRVGATFQENWTDGYAFQVEFRVKTNVVIDIISGLCMTEIMHLAPSSCECKDCKENRLIYS